MLVLPSMSVQHHSGGQTARFHGAITTTPKLNVNRIKALEIYKIENIDCSNTPGSANL